MLRKLNVQWGTPVRGRQDSLTNTSARGEPGEWQARSGRVLQNKPPSDKPPPQAQTPTTNKQGTLPLERDGEL